MPRETTTGLQEPAGVCDILGLDLLDTPPEEGFDRLTRLASRTLDVPIALVNLIDGDRQFFKSATGMGDVRELPVGTGICSYALASREPLVIEDARADPRFSSNPIVTRYGLVAYIGIPLVTSAGHPLGTFCVVDLEPRAWQDGDVETMRELASAVLTEVTSASRRGSWSGTPTRRPRPARRRRRLTGACGSWWRGWTPSCGRRTRRPGGSPS